MKEQSGVDLTSLYDKVACEFLRGGWQKQPRRIPDRNTLETMRKNIPLVAGQRIPGTCDVLTTYLMAENPALKRLFRGVVGDVQGILGKDFDCYEVPPDDRHISLVMLHDLRPEDMGSKKMKRSVLPAPAVRSVRSRIKAAIKEADNHPYKLTLYGLRFSASDGALMAVFVDDGETRSLRKGIGDSVKEYLNPKLLKYDKPFIHTTLFRPMDQLPPQHMPALREMQRDLYRMADRKITMPVKEIMLGRESKWMHSQVKVIERFPLV